MIACQISEIVTRVLDFDPDPVVRLRLERDLLHLPASELVVQKKSIAANPWVRQLAFEQYPDGSWGRFHSRDSQSGQKIITTEFGVARGLSLGLDASHPVFCRTVDYLTQLLRGTIAFPDRTERNDRWPVGVQLFVASTLAQLKPQHPFVDDAWHLWAEIAARAFTTGVYNAQAEIQAHRELSGATIKDSYLVLNNKYTFTLLAARPKDLPLTLAVQLLTWVWGHPAGLRYLGVPAWKRPVGAHPTTVDHWFTTQEILARLPGWPALAGDLKSWLWDQLASDGLWDFGPRAQGSYYFPLSANWRKAQYRKFDWTTRTLDLLAKLEY